jgi:hypothetical protein
MKKNCLTTLVLLFTLAACDNQEVTHHSWSFSQSQASRSIASFYVENLSYGGLGLEQVMKSHTCKNAASRIKIEIPLLHYKHLRADDLYLGVTAYGDIGVISGKTLKYPPLFTAFLCPRGKLELKGQLSNIQIGGYSEYVFKPITNAHITLNTNEKITFKKLDKIEKHRKRFPASLCL